MRKTDHLLKIKKQAQVDKPLFNFLNSQTVQIPYGKWEVREMDSICPLIEEWKTFELWLNSNSSKSILLAIKEIRFSSLVGLSLFENEIQSVESLSHIFMPFLTWIQLSTSFLYGRQQLSCMDFFFQKSQFSCPFQTLLTYLFAEVDNNRIMDGEELVKLKNPLLALISFQILNRQPKQCHQIEWIVKMETKKLQTVSSTYKRIMPLEAVKAVKRAHPLINISCQE